MSRGFNVWQELGYDFQDTFDYVAWLGRDRSRFQ
jgi:hypothetical protein